MKKRIYVLLTDTSTVFSRVIKLYTKKKYTHASISFNKELTQVYSFGRKKPTNPFNGGFVQEHLDCKLYSNADCVLYSCEITEEEYAKMLKQVLRMTSQKEQYRYSLLGVIGVALNKEIKRENAFFCSQFVATILEEGGVSVSDKPLGLVTPDDIAQSSKFKLEYRWRMKDYEFFKNSECQNETNDDSININTGFTY